MKLDIFDKLPKGFLGMLIGITFGGIGGGIFGDIGFASYIPWEEIFIFLGALFGFIIGWKSE